MPRTKPTDKSPSAVVEAAIATRRTLRAHEAGTTKGDRFLKAAAAFAASVALPGNVEGRPVFAGVDPAKVLERLAEFILTADMAVIGTVTEQTTNGETQRPSVFIRVPTPTRDQPGVMTAFTAASSRSVSHPDGYLTESHAVLPKGLPEGSEGISLLDHIVVSGLYEEGQRLLNLERATAPID